MGTTSLLLGAIGEAPGRLDGELAHRRRRIAALVSLAVGTASDLEEQYLIDLVGLTLGGSLEQFTWHDHQGAQIALGMVAQPESARYWISYPIFRDMIRSRERPRDVIPAPVTPGR